MLNITHPAYTDTAAIQFQSQTIKIFYSKTKTFSNQNCQVQLKFEHMTSSHSCEISNFSKLQISVNPVLTIDIILYVRANNILCQGFARNRSFYMGLP